MLPTVTPQEAARLVREEGAVLADVREPQEFAGPRIAGAQNLPLSRLARMELGEGTGPVVFLCQSGMRTRRAGAMLQSKAGARRAWVLEGGLNGWRRAGLPVEGSAEGGGNGLSPWLLALAGGGAMLLAWLMLRAYA